VERKTMILNFLAEILFSILIVSVLYLAIRDYEDEK